jgi:hypothetical protein
MLENSFGLIFFLKAPRHNESNIRSVYFRITVDGIPKEASTRRQWDTERWNKKTERATGTKEDAKSLNFFLDSLTAKIHEIKSEIMYTRKFFVSCERLTNSALNGIPLIIADSRYRILTTGSLQSMGSCVRTSA